MYTSFKQQYADAPTEGPLVVSITTLGGDPEMARAMGDSIRLLRDYTGREALFLGKVAVYSAGATFMSAFPVNCRFLTRGTRLMIHERSLTSTVQLSGPLSTLPDILKAKLHEIEHSMRIQDEGFAAIVKGSRLTLDGPQVARLRQLVCRCGGRARPGTGAGRDIKHWRGRSDHHGVAPPPLRA